LLNAAFCAMSAIAALATGHATAVAQLDSPARLPIGPSGSRTRNLPLKSKGCQLSLPLVSNIAGLVYSIYQHKHPSPGLNLIDTSGKSGRIESSEIHLQVHDGYNSVARAGSVGRRGFSTRRPGYGGVFSDAYTSLSPSWTRRALKRHRSLPRTS
jgi:hypothetical protein